MPEIAEAQALLEVLAETDEVKAEAERRQRRQHLQVSYGNALIAARGFGAAETTEAFARARDAAYGEKDAPERLAADFGLWAGSYTRGELTSMRVHAAAFLADVAGKPDLAEAGIAYRCQGITSWFAGEYLEARDHLQRALATFQPGRDDELAYRFSHDPGVPAMAYLALVLWSIGEVDNALPLVERMRERIDSLSHANTLALGTMHASMFALMRGDHSRLRTCALELVRIVREHDLRLFRAFGEFLEGWATADVGALTDGLEGMRRGVESLRKQNALVFDGLIKIALSEGEARAGDLESAVATLEEALATVERTGYRAFEAELRRARGEILLRRDPTNFADAEQAFQTAVAVARQQRTRSFELRAATSLAKLYRSTGRRIEAHAVLAPALEGFSPTPEMPEIAEAQALLAALAEMGEVKVAIAQRKRRVDLQTSYARAVSFSKGWGADETKAAFKRAGDLATRDELPAKRFYALFGQAGWSLQRGEVRAARDIAERALRGAEAEGPVAAFAAARQTLGLAFLFLGDLAKARSEFELALNSFNIESVSEASEKFLWDAGAECRACLAQASWYSGDLHRSRQLIEEATGRELGPLPSTAYALASKIYIEGHRNDLESVVADAENLLKIGQQHGMDFYVAISRVYLSWARGGLGDARSGVDQLRNSLDTYATQGNRLGVPYFLGCLAELEAAAGDNERALALIDEGLAMADEGGQHVWDAFLHRLRGEILLKRDHANTAPAEEAYQTAIAIAKRQGARSYELLASLALAKLYQSSDRTADAHAVLTPALEGFSPTPEMPEIAEAQTLLESLARGGEEAIPSIGQATKG